MNVKQLITKLMEFDPETQVYIELPTDERFGLVECFSDYNINGRLVAIISPITIPNGEGNAEIGQ